MTERSDLYFMQQAFELAQRARSLGEVPVGAVLVYEGKVIGEGWNQPITTHDPTAHAEIIALRSGASAIGNYRLLNTTLYVTLEPCAMCAVAMVHARVGRLVFAAADLKTGAAGSVFQLLNDERLNHQVLVESGVMERECSELLSDFFRQRRAEKKKLRALRASEDRS